LAQLTHVLEYGKSNDQGNKTTPSCVAFTDSQRLIGHAAKNQASSNPTNTIFGNSFLFLFYVSSIV